MFKKYYYILIILIKVSCGSTYNNLNAIQDSCFNPNKRLYDKTKIVPKLNDFNEKEGSIVIEFPLFSNCNLYEVKIRRIGNNCTEIGYIDHSDYILKTNSSTNSGNLRQCKEFERIKLKYIYTGCYEVEFLMSEERIARQKIYWETNYYKRTFSNCNYIGPSIQFRENDLIFDFTHPFLKKKPMILIWIICDNCTVLSNNSSNPYVMTSNKYNFCDNSLETDVIKMCFTCTLNRNESYIKCVFKNLDNGSYKVRMQLMGLIPCNWESCTAEVSGTKFTVAERKTPPEPINLTWIIFGICCIIFTAIIVFIIYRYRFLRIKNIETPQYVYDSEEILMGSKYILLLYPRDVEEVMETMKALRNALKVKGFEVFDIHDDKLEKFISQNPRKWIFDILSDKNVKIITPLTYCAQILANCNNNIKTIYKKPTWSDDLFPYAISLLREKINPNNYTKVFIVNIGFDCMDYAVFDFLVPSTKYGLPECFEELLRDLQNKRYCTVDVIYNDEVEMKEFLQCHQRMMDYVKNIYYLEKILNVEISNFDNAVKIKICNKDI